MMSDLPVVRSLIAVAMCAAFTCCTHAQCGNWVIPQGASFVGGTSVSARAMLTWDADGPGPQPELLIVAGSFAQVNSWNPVTGQWAGMGGLTQKSSIGLFDGRLYVGGHYASGTSRFIRYDTPTSASVDLSWGMSGNDVRAITVYQNAVVLGGGFSYLPVAELRYLARWTGTEYQPIGSGVSGVVNSLVVYNGDLIAGGVFANAGGVAVSNIARWNGTEWSAMGDGVVGEVSCMAVHGGKLYVGGLLTEAGGAPVHNIAAWDGASWSTVGTGDNEGVSGGVNALTTFDGRLIVGGGFAAAGLASAMNIAAWDSSTATWTTLGAGFPSTVRSFAVSGNRLYVGGDRYLPQNTTIAYWEISTEPSVGVQPPFSVRASCQLATIVAAPAAGAAESPGGVGYQWRRNGVPISNGAGGASAGGGTVFNAEGTLTVTQPVTLTILNPKSSDMGSYTVLFTNACGSDESLVSQLSLCRSDFNCDGIPSIDDLFSYFNAYFVGDPRADFDQRNGVTIDDLFQFINVWFSGC